MAIPASQISTGSTFTAGALSNRVAAGTPNAKRPRITPKSGTNTELSISKKGSRLCIGSSMASRVQASTINTPN